MLKWIHLFKNYYFGLSLMGIIIFCIQEIPYMIMPLIKPNSNPITNISNEIVWLENLQMVSGIFTMILLMLTIKGDEALFPFDTSRNVISFVFMVSMILINFVGWGFYYSGKQVSWLIILSQFAVVPLYYMFYGLWKENYMIVGSSSLFFIIHTINGILNFGIEH